MSLFLWEGYVAGFNAIRFYSQIKIQIYVYVDAFGQKLVSSITQYTVIIVFDTEYQLNWCLGCLAPVLTAWLKFSFTSLQEQLNFVSRLLALIKVFLPPICSLSKNVSCCIKLIIHSLSICTVVSSEQNRSHGSTLLPFLLLFSHLAVI